jgi:O-antigen ligase
MTAYSFRVFSAIALFVLIAFAVLAFGAVDLWAQVIFETGVFLLSAVWIVRMGLGRARLVWNPIWAPWGVAALWTWLQFGLGLSVNRYRTEAEALKWLALWLLLVIACQVFVDDSIKTRFNLGMVWFGFALCIFGLVQHFTSPRMVYWLIPVASGKVFGPFINANHFATLMELIVPCALLLALRVSEQRLIYIVLANLILASVVVSASRAGVLLVAGETVVVLGAAALLPPRSGRRRDKKRFLLPAAGLAAAALLSFYVSSSRGLFERFQEEQPYGLRWTVARATWRLFLTRPWTGYGAGTFDQVYPSAAPFDAGLFWAHAHNDPAEFAMEWGVIGLAVLGATICLLFIRRWPRNLWLTVVLPAMAVLVHSWFDFPLQIPAVAAVWFTTLAQLTAAGRKLPEAQTNYAGRRNAPIEAVPAAKD